MKTIIDVLEKLKVDYIKFDNFPIDGTFDEILEFLKEEGFREAVELPPNPISNVLNKERSKCFINSNDKIWFADTSKEDVSRNNPIFFIEKIGRQFSVYSVYIPNKFIVNDNKKAFLEELNKRFGRR